MKKQWKRLTALLLTFVLLSINVLTAVAVEENTASEIQNYSLSVEVAGQGTVTVSGEGAAEVSSGSYTVTAGSEAVISAVPQEGQELKSMTLNGETVTDSFTMPWNDSVLQVDFQQIPETAQKSEEQEEVSVSDRQADELEEIEQTPEETESEEQTLKNEKTESSDFMERVTAIERKIIEQEGGNPDIVNEQNRMQMSRAGQPKISDVIGMDGSLYIEWLSSHENDTYYLTTPYRPYAGEYFADWRSPNGDPSFNGSAAMNCTGFVWHALMKPTAQSGGNTAIIPGLSGWVTFYTQNNIERRYFATKEEMLSSGYLEKGDIIWMFAGGEGTISDYHHVGIYWGNGTEDILWHSIDGASDGNGMPYDGNVISHIFGKTAQPIYVVLKTGGEEKGNLELYKASANPELTDGNSCYSLAGAVYGLYKNGQEAARLTTNASGYAIVTGLQKGNYILKEITPPKGYALDKTEYPVTINSSQTTRVDVKDFPQSDPVGVLLGKIDAETTQNMPQGSASLENAEFTFKFYGVESKTDPAEAGHQPLRTWVMKTNNKGFTMLEEKYKVSGDDFYYSESGYITLPIGTLTIQETKAPKGYLLNDKMFVRQITSEGIGESVSTYNEPIVSEEVIRGDVQIVKFAGDGSGDDTDLKKPLKDIKFTFTSKTTGLSYSVLTDENGYADTQQLGNPRGNLIHDTYIVTEESPYPEYDIIEPFEVTISEEGQKLYYIIENDKVEAPVSVVKKDATTGKTIPVAGAKFQVLDEEKNVIEMTVSHYPSLIKQDTWETDGSGSFTLPEKLEAGTYYLKEVEAPSGYLQGKLLEFQVTGSYEWDNPLVIEYEDAPAMGKISIRKTDEETGKPLAHAWFEVTAAEDIVTPDGTVRATAGEVVDEIGTDSDGIAETKELYLGKYTVTEVWQPDGYVLPENNTWEVELKYKDQNTELVVEELNVANRQTEIIIDKKVTGSEERLEGVKFAVCREMEPMREISEDDLECQVFVTDENGKIDLKGLGEGTYYIKEIQGLPGYAWDDTVYEVIIDEYGRVNGELAGIVTVENAQTKITETNVIDVKTDSQSVYPKELTAVDTVSMVNLQVGETYQLKGEIRDALTGLPVREDSTLTGEILTVEKEFEATARDMDVEMTFSFDAETFAGRTLVVFETLYQDGVEISSHTDLNDKKQQLYIKNPTLHTTAADVESGTHEAIAKKDVKIRDHVEYEDILEGTYCLKGVVMLESTGKPLEIDGKQVTAEKEVEITEESGVMDMDFTFDASELNNQSVVIYEYLYQDGELIASHEDIHDKNQTVTFKVGSLKATIPPTKGSGLLRTKFPKTGDMTVFLPYFILLLGAGAAVTTVGVMKKRNEKEKRTAEKETD